MGATISEHWEAGFRCFGIATGETPTHMTPIQTAALKAEIDGSLVRLSVTGTPTKDELDAVMAWFDELQAQYQDIPLYLEMPKMHFDGLGDMRKAFFGLAHIMRGMEDIEKCAVVTDSPFLRSTAQVEGAVLPNMDVDTFGIVELAEAEQWLESEAA